MKTMSGLARGAMVAVMALTLALVGCGGTQDTDSLQGFTGTWSVDADAITEGGAALEGDELAAVQSTGAYLTLSEDGSATFEMLGTEVVGTWEPEGASSARLTLDEGIAGADAGEATITLKGDRLEMEGAGQSIVFVKAEPPERDAADSSASSDADDSSGGKRDGSDSSSTTTQSVPSSFTDFIGLDVTVTDTDLFCVRLVGRGGYYDDAGYLISVENKGDEEVFVRARSPFTLGESEIRPNLDMVVAAHETGTGVLWFAADEVGDGQSVISGTIEVCDKGGKVLGTCVVTL